MATIIAIQDGSTLGPGRLGATLRDTGYRVDARRVDRHGPDALPKDLDNVHGLLLLGSEQDPTSELPWITRTLDLVREAHRRELPVVGLCMGCELIARALGGELEPMPAPRVGFFPVNLTVPGQTEAMLAGIPWSVHQFQSNAFRVAKAPPGATVLAASDDCPIEAFRAGVRTYAFQYHPEFDRATITALVAQRLAQLRELGLSLEAIEAQLDSHYDRFARAADRLCVNLTSFAFPFDRLLAV